MYTYKPDPQSLKSTGNAALAIGLSNRQVTFLRRNWIASLDAHERRYQANMSASAVRGHTSVEGSIVASQPLSRETQLKTWCDTSKKTLRNFLELQQQHRHRPPAIEITRLVIRHRNAFNALQIATPASTPGLGQDTMADPDWFPAEKQNKVSCTGIVTGTNGYIRTQQFNGHLMLVDKQWVLELNMPLLVDVLIHHSMSGHRSNEVENGLSVSLVIDSEEHIGLRIRLFTTDEVLTRLALAPSAAQRDVDLQDARQKKAFAEYGSKAILLDTIEAAIELQPKLPEAITAVLNHDSLDMQMCCKWVVDSSSDLEAFNERTKCYSEHARNHLPSPCRSDRPAEVSVVFIFQNKTQYTQKSLACPFCGPSFDYKQFRRLQLHLLTHHDHFKIEVEPCDAGMIVRLDLADKLPGKANINDDDTLKIEWIAPARPFNIDDYIHGDRSWAGERRHGPRPSTRGRRPTKARKVSVAHAPAERIYKRLPPHQVPDLRRRNRESHPVPRVLDSKGDQIPFYRPNSKRPFTTGEMVSNSDDDVDDSWIRERRRQNLDKLVKSNRKATEGAARFMADWDTHIDIEELQGVSGDVLKRDSAIRFARQCCSKLDDAEYREAWTAKVMRLKKYNLFDQTDVDYCLRLINQRPLATAVVTESTEAGDGVSSSGVTHEADSVIKVTLPCTPVRTAERSTQQSLQNSDSAHRLAFETERRRSELLINRTETTVM